MTRNRANIAASVAARLLNRAKQTGDDYQTVLAAYCFERFLYRLGASSVRDRFALKGAMLMRLWADQPYRATRDLDLLRRGHPSAAAVLDDIRQICTVPVVDDGVLFDIEATQVEPIRVEDEYAGSRTLVPVRCGTARLTLQIDMGVGDAVWPPPKSVSYPALLDLPSPNVLAYPREAVVAEKFEAMVVLGDRNSRIKDFFDLHYLASRFEFDRTVLTEAIRRTFARRSTPVPAGVPIALTPLYWDNPSRPAQIRAFARRANLPITQRPGADFLELLSSFFSPILEDLRTGDSRPGIWKPGGPWH
jgi:hypothetical protein